MRRHASPRARNRMAPLRRSGSLFLLIFAACNRKPESGIRASGTVEVIEVDLAPTAAARVVTMKVDEGMTVEAGDTVAVLTQSDLPATLAGQRARLAMAQASLRDLQAGARPQEIRRAEAELAAAEAAAVRTKRELERVRSLVAAGGPTSGGASRRSTRMRSSHPASHSPRKSGPISLLGSRSRCRIRRECSSLACRPPCTSRYDGPGNRRHPNRRLAQGVR